MSGLVPNLDNDYQNALDRFCSFIGKRKLFDASERRMRFVAHINQKFRINSDPLAKFYQFAAGMKITFNFHQKNEIQQAFDLSSESELVDALNRKGLSDGIIKSLISRFEPVSEECSLKFLRQECAEPTKLRIEKGDRDIQAEILKSHLSAYLWTIAPKKDLFAFFDPNHSEEGYKESFWDQLHQRSPNLFSRHHSLQILKVTNSFVSQYESYEQIQNWLCSRIKAYSDEINNHGYLAILIDITFFKNREITFELAADSMLYAEKHIQSNIDANFFRHREIADETSKYITTLKEEFARFDIANEGLHYRDCFILLESQGTIRQLLVLFQKNQRDETKIPCPSCRSDEVRPNSYPSLGVRSWECANILCPERSKYNRGKRYSFKSLMMQQAIDDERNAIEQKSVRAWARDIVIASESDAVEMLIKHYSLFGDHVHLEGFEKAATKIMGRKVKYSQAVTAKEKRDSHFWDGPFFQRYAVATNRLFRPAVPLYDCSGLRVYQGDSAEVLQSIESNCIDAAVTSPPYFNAREYSQWQNIYCYLWDMKAVNEQVFRLLKSGSLYFFNIFDYFDNERSIVFSAMGQKRMILSAYFTDLFRRIGFECLGNIVWDKGEIEGKRAFNAGNFSPYYQSPFNCWEHVLVFRKPLKIRTKTGKAITSGVLKEKPVFKMVGGKNVHGHTAPFPDAIVKLAIDGLKPNSVILDPFAGSLTSGRVAIQLGHQAICVEQSLEYCQLGLSKLDGMKQPFLF